MEIIRSHPQFVVSKVFDSTTQRLIFVVFVYGSHDSKKCKKLWRDLKGSIPNYDFPWMAVGDFNAIELLVKRKVGEFVVRDVLFFEILWSLLRFMT